MVKAKIGGGGGGSGSAWTAGAVMAGAIVALLVAVSLMSSAQEARVAEGFAAMVRKEAFVSSGPVAAAVIPSGAAAGAAAGVQRRKGELYGRALARFFTVADPATVAAALAQYLLYFQPTSGDVMCDFTNDTIQTANKCAVSVDSMSCVDRTTRLAATRTRGALQLAGVTQDAGAVDSSSCVVYIMGGAYRLLKNALRVPLDVYVQQGQQRGGSVHLVLPRCDYATRAIMLLRPSFVRVGGSRLYEIDWDAPGTDGPSYDSHPAPGATMPAPAVAVLLLVPADERLDPPAAGTQMRGGLAEDVAGAGMQQRGSALAAPPARGPYEVRLDGRIAADLQLYYLNYMAPDPKVLPGSATGVASAFARILPTINAAVRDSNNGVVLKLSRQGALQRNILADVGGSLGVGGGSAQATVPAFENGIVVASVSVNLLLLAAVSPTRTSVRRVRVAMGGSAAGGSYVPSAREDDLPDFAKALGLNTRCLPNLAAVAAATGALQVEPDAECAQTLAEGVPLAVARAPSDTLMPDTPLLPGGTLVSADGKFTAVFQADCNLVVYTNGGGVVWASNTASSESQPARLQLGANDGVLAMQNASGTVYWRSTRGPLPVDQAPFRLVLASGTGALQIIGQYGAGPAWASDGGLSPTGVTFMHSCTAAASKYASDHAQDLARPENAGMTPWTHYSTVGKIQGWEWPGPDC